MPVLRTATSIISRAWILLRKPRDCAQTELGIVGDFESVSLTATLFAVWM